MANVLLSPLCLLFVLATLQCHCMVMARRPTSELCWRRARSTIKELPRLTRSALSPRTNVFNFRTSSRLRKETERDLAHRLSSLIAFPDGRAYLSNLRLVGDTAAEAEHPCISRPRGVRRSEVLRTLARWRERRHASQQRRKRAIFGRDDRLEIYPEWKTSHPYAAFVRVITPTSSCTGTLLSPLHILTAAHCLHDQTSFIAGIDQIRVGIQNGANQTKWFSVGHAHLPLGWVQGREHISSAGYDFALITMQTCLTNIDSYLKMAEVESPPFLNGRLSMVSYENSPRMRYTTCSAAELGAGLVYHECDATPGSDGSGMYSFVRVDRLKGYRRRLVGVFSGNQWRFDPWRDEAFRNFNVGVQTFENETRHHLQLGARALRSSRLGGLASHATRCRAEETQAVCTMCKKSEETRQDENVLFFTRLKKKLSEPRAILLEEPRNNRTYPDS